MSETVAEIVEDEVPVLDEVYIIDEDEGDLQPANSWCDAVTERLGELSSKEGTARDAAKFLDDVQIIAKSVQGSRQVVDTLLQENERTYFDLSGRDAVPPPYSPELMMTFSQTDEVVHTCVRTKAFDATQRGYTFHVSETPANPDITEESDEFKADLAKVRNFIRTCNYNQGLLDVLLRVAMDSESIGWGALEVVRNVKGEVSKIDHIPASRIQPLKGMRGFKEIAGEGGSEVYYQVFGDKYLSPGRVGPLGIKEQYDPRLDGNNAVPNFIDYQTGEPTADVRRAANEVVWVPKPHPATIYYGVTDTVPALSQITGNIHIRQFLLQFFEHNTVPRYVVIVKGAKLDDPMKKEIKNFFQNQVRGRAHKTLMLPIPKNNANIEVEFKRLDSDPKDGWFKNTQADNQHAIRIAHGVPAAVAGFNDTASLGSGKTLGQVELYKDRVVVPLQEKWADILNRIFVLGLRAVNVSIKFNELDVRDRESLMRTLTAYWDRGIISTNNVRQELGYPPVAGGDRLFVKVGNSIVFLDEIDSLRSGPVADMNPVIAEEKKKLAEAKQPSPNQRGGDQRDNVPAGGAATMTPERAAAAVIQNEGREA